ncbi:MAG: large conductance mechanosensitive channel protein MscL [Clostridiales bacterium]|nr:large conductance mechanosensitive channel protein MscL [Clostridiales bacterium]
MLKEFKKFAFKGNAVDMAVGVIIGGAFGTIVTSLVNDLITPLIGLLFKADFSELFVLLKSPDGVFFPAIPETAEAFTLAAAKELGYITFNYGAFLTNLLNFLIVAFALFLVVRALNAPKARKAAAQAPAPPTTKKCPYCLSEIPLEAMRCAHCTSELPTAEEAVAE